MISRLSHILRSFLKEPAGHALLKEIQEQRFVTGQVLSRLSAGKEVKSLHEAEFKVFSQFGDDGIIQHLIRQEILPETFVEFGVENYCESNTRFLLMNNNWKGLVIDASHENIEFIRKDAISWRHDLTSIESFVTRDNINALLSGNGFSGEIGLLSIDIDGNDYWIWECLTVVQPVLVVVEYNSILGSRLPITIPYEERFHRTAAHPSNLYWGTSLPALEYLAVKKGYRLVGCNSAGNNAYFVRNGSLPSLAGQSSAEAHVLSKFRESRNAEGALNFLSGRRRIEEIRSCVVVNVETGKTHTIDELLAEIHP